MKRVLIAGLAALLAGCGKPAAPPKTEDATTELKHLMDKVTAGWVTLDPSKVAQYYAKEAGMAFYDIAPLKYADWSEYERGAKRTFSLWKSIKLTINPDFQGYKNGNIAWATYTSSFEITPDRGPVMKGVARNSNVFEKRGEEWIIVHEHASVPMLDAPAPPKAKAAQTPAKGKKKKKR